MKGQLEISFQFILVIIAIGVVAGIFFFLFKGCQQEGETKLSSEAVSETAAIIDTIAYQGNTIQNITLPELEVRCPAGALTIVKDQESATINTPVFLPPHIGNAVTIISKDVMLKVPDAPSVRLGSVLYGFDQSTFYVVHTSVAAAHPDLMKILSYAQVQTVSSFALMNVADAKTVVLITSGAPPSTVNIGIKACAVQIEPTTVKFYQYNGNNLETTPRVEQINDESLLLGAIISGTPQGYSCGKQQFNKRLKVFLDISQKRMQALTPVVDERCITSMRIQNSSLAEILASSDTIATLYSAQDLTRAQYQLYTAKCPVFG